VYTKYSKLPILVLSYNKYSVYKVDKYRNLILGNDNTGLVDLDFLSPCELCDNNLTLSLYYYIT